MCHAFRHVHADMMVRSLFRHTYGKVRIRISFDGAALASRGERDPPGAEAGRVVHDALQRRRVLVREVGALQPNFGRICSKPFPIVFLPDAS